jgi:two-component sensor histidine kinase
VSTLTDLVAARTVLTPPDVAVLQALVGEWQLVSDLSFADLVLWVRTTDGDWLAVAHMRPTTGTTTYPEDVVGVALHPGEAPWLEQAARQGRIVRDGDADWRATSVRQEAVPVFRAGALIAVLSRETVVGAGRSPSALELAYQTSAGELLQMVSESTFPYPGASSDPETSPRAGDGMLRLDRTGHIVYVSPNALSAFRRLGVTGDLLGTHLGQTIARLSAPGPLDEPRGSAALAAALRFREPRDTEVEAQAATVQMRIMPIVTASEPRGALVLVRNVTELRRRELQIMGKDATIREIHHRVKNNLQTVAALLRLQARRLSDPAARAALEVSVRRVGSIATVHETLSLSLDETVDFDPIADKVLAMCAEVAVAESQVHVSRQGRFGQLPAEVATPLSMVITELVQNAVEHGYPSGTPGPRGEGGKIVVRVERLVDLLDVTVEDDGVGLPEGFAAGTSKRLGLQIVRTLVESELRGRIALANRLGGGARVQVVLPLETAEPES